MLHSTLAPGYSMTAYAGAVGGRSLGLALVWWPVALGLSIAYWAFVLRHYRYRVRPVSDPR